MNEQGYVHSTKAISRDGLDGSGLYSATMFLFRCQCCSITRIAYGLLEAIYWQLNSEVLQQEPPRIVQILKGDCKGQPIAAGNAVQDFQQWAILVQG